jgi:serine/threonine protein kinase
MASLENDATVSAGSGGGDEIVSEDVPAGAQVGEYVVEKKLGEGGFGAVYRAVHPLIGKVAAVKVLHRAFSQKGDMVQRFIAEARAVNQIRNRNIIDIFAFGQLPDGRHYYVMELLEGAAFDSYLDKVGRMDLRAALPIFRAVGRALDAAHAAGIVHRDLKPENVFLVQHDDGTLFPKLLDFGIAKLLPSNKEKTGGGGVKTQTGMQIGTPYYMSPEQCRGIGVDHRTDIYAFGVMVHRTLTGQMPFDGESMMDIMMKHMASAPPPMSQVFPELAPLDASVARMLAKDPAERPQSHAAALDALEQAARGAGIDIPTSPMAVGALSGSGLPASGNLRELTPAPAPATTDLGMSSMSARKGGRPVLYGALAFIALVAIGVGVIVLKGVGRETPAKDSTTAATTNATTVKSTTATTAATTGTATETATATTTATATGTGAATASSQPATMLVKFDVQPKGATIFRGDDALGIAPGPIALPVGEKTALRIVAPGYVTKTIDVTPSAGLVVKASLVHEVGSGKPTVAKPISSDLESPF